MSSRYTAEHGQPPARGGHAVAWEGCHLGGRLGRARGGRLDSGGRRAGGIVGSAAASRLGRLLGRGAPSLRRLLALLVLLLQLVQPGQGSTQ